MPGPITRAIQDRYLGIAGGRYPDVHGWLTPVPARAGAAEPDSAELAEQPQPV
jgi:hypothetical protein